MSKLPPGYIPLTHHQFSPSQSGNGQGGGRPGGGGQGPNKRGGQRKGGRRGGPRNSGHGGEGGQGRDRDFEPRNRNEGRDDGNSFDGPEDEEF